MICERLSFTANVEAIRQHYQAEIAPKYEPAMQTPYFGGWTIQSTNGDYRDGWAAGGYLYERQPDGEYRLNEEKAAQIGLRPVSDYAQYTQVCTGPIRELMETVAGFGFQPRRARMTLLLAGAEGKWHQDYPDSEYGMRLQIPIVSNEKCRFFTKEGCVHMPADGSVFAVWVNTQHRVENLSDQNRIHIIMDAWDTKGVSKYHRYAEAKRATR